MENNSEDNDKPRKQSLNKKIFEYYNYEMNKKTYDFVHTNPNYFDVNFSLFQKITDKEKLISTIYELGYFYDTNFVGNKDFMHIPSIRQIIENAKCYPILLATQKINNFNEIIGTTTIKYELNNSFDENPFFPTKNEKVFSITGMLTKRNIVDRFGNRIKGIGKELYKSAIETAYRISKNEKIRLICEVDCRNDKSLNAICQSVKELKEKLNINVILKGYYERKDLKGILKEAPTFIIEIILDGKTLIDESNKTFSFVNCNKKNLLNDLKKVIEQNTIELSKKESILFEEIICYHNIKPIDALKIYLDVGDTADANDRIPVLDKIMQINAVQI